MANKEKKIKKKKKEISREKKGSKDYRYTYSKKDVNSIVKELKEYCKGLGLSDKEVKQSVGMARKAMEKSSDYDP